jgi:hypothetical protein
MAQLIEPDGTLNTIVTVEYAVRYCANHLVGPGNT